MANATPSRLGIINGVSPSNYEQENALFLKKFSGEVLTAFNETNVMKDLHLIRTIESGRSAQFPATWKTGAGYHTPGNLITGAQSIKHNERTIVIDDLLISDVFIANIDEAKNHYDVRSIYSTQVGEALARVFDQNTMQVGVLAARASATVNGGFGGGEVTEADARTDGNKLAAAIFGAATLMDEKDVPDTDRVALVKPAQYYTLVQAKDTINKDWGGSGSYSDGSITRIADVVLRKTNRVPTANVSPKPGENNTYGGNFQNVAALVMHKSAIGTVKLMDLTMQMTGEEYAVMYQGTLMVGKYAMGHGILRPECAVEINVTAN